MRKLTDETLIKELMEEYGWSREETINGYGIFACYNSDTCIEGAEVVEAIGELNEEFDYGFECSDFKACRQAEIDGVKFINDIKGLEKGYYIDTPENRKLCIKELSEHPEYRIENWLFKEEFKMYKELYIKTFGNPLEEA